ncbi:MAG: DUF1573 domain-containing protein [Planctomycetota bacterium]
MAFAFALLAVPSALPGGVALHPRVVDFGDRGHDERPSATLSLRNDGTAPVKVLAVEKTCDCLAISPRSIPAPIPPGGSAVLEVSMASGRAIGALEKYIDIRTDDPRAPSIRVPVRMRVFDGFSIEPRELHFDGVCGGEPLAQSVAVAFSRRDVKRDFALAFDGVFDPARKAAKNPHFRGSVAALKGGKRIDIVLEPTHPEGRIWAELHASLDGRKLVIPIAGEMFRWIKVVPTYFNFSRVSADDPKSLRREVLLASTDGREFRIVSMTPEFRTAVPPGLELELDSKGAVPGQAATEHTISAAIALPPELRRPARDEAEARASVSLSGRVVVETDHPEKPKIELSFFGFVARPRPGK